MHGVKRQRISKSQEEQKRKEEADQVVEYKSLVEECLKRKENQDYSEEAYTLTNKVLDFNCEFYTVWAYRRNILLQHFIPNDPPSSIYKRLSFELRLTGGYLKGSPKSYWVWNHRRWVLDNIPSGSPDDDGQEGQDSTGPKTVKTEEGYKNEAWGRELMLCERMMESDPRNFHAWDYLRYITSHLPTTFSPPRTNQQELKYTTRKIESNFSNFSAWHQRTKVLEKVWKDMMEGVKDEEELQQVKVEQKRMKAEEFELVTQALWVDPKDQSGWLYHRWLINDGSDVQTLIEQIEMIKELLEVEEDAKWPMESLVHYTMLRMKQPSTTDEGIKAFKDDVLGWLDRLIIIDPSRKERYRELSLDCAKVL